MILDDEGYDSSKEKERRRQFVREQRRKSKMRTPSVQDNVDMLGSEFTVVEFHDDQNEIQ